MRYFGLMMLLLCTTCNAGQELRHYRVDLPVSSSLGTDFFPDILRMALEASKAPDEVIELKFSEQKFSQARWIAEVRKSQVNMVYWTITSKEREQSLRPVRIPLFKGLLGYRLLVIRKEQLAAFARVNGREDLQQLVAGQGSHWPDTEVLRAAQLPVMEGLSSDNLYKMLAAKRFDYFPRGITETDQEMNIIRSQNLVIEPHLLLIYPTAMYFFVNKNNVELAERLEKGLEKLIKTGEYDRKFYALPRVKAAMEELARSKRTVIHLDNPLLPAETPLHEARYWLHHP